MHFKHINIVQRIWLQQQSGRSDGSLWPLADIWAAMVYWHFLKTGVGLCAAELKRWYHPHVRPAMSEAFRYLA